MKGKKSYSGRRQKIERGATGLVTGLIAGTLMGFVIEIGAGGGEAVMALGALAGVGIGVLCDIAYCRWRNQRAKRFG